jgi:cbb3-type cytochrome oxidase maturation protein
MDILYLLIPLSAVLVLMIIGVFGWALHRGQFDDVEREGQRILQSDGSAVDADQSAAPDMQEQSRKVFSDPT